jgi:CHAD domain-containing protein
MERESRGDVQAEELSAAELVHTSLGRNTGQLIAADPIIRAETDPEGVHQMRVASRRLRAELRLLAPVLKPKPIRHLRAELRWLGVSLGATRDLDTIGPYLSAPPDLEGAEFLTSLIAQKLSGDVDAAHRATLEVLRSPRYARLLHRLVSSVLEPPLRLSAEASARSVLTPALRAATNALTDAVWTLPPSPELARLHHVRILAKRLRYGASTAAAIDGELALRVVSVLGKVQDALGEMRDAERARQLLCSLEIPPGAQRTLEAMLQSCDDAITSYRGRWWVEYDDALGLLATLRWFEG